MVRQVSVRNTNTGKIVTCSAIPRGGECSVRFPAQVNRGDPATLTWEQSGVTHSMPLRDRRPLDEQNFELATVVITIGDNGTLETQLR